MIMIKKKTVTMIIAETTTAKIIIQFQSLQF